MEIHCWLLRILGLVSIAACFDGETVEKQFEYPTSNELSEKQFKNDTSTSNVFSTRDDSLLLEAVIAKRDMEAVSLMFYSSGNATCIGSIDNENTSRAATDISASISTDSDTESLNVRSTASPESDDLDVDLNETDTTFLSFDEWKKIKLNQESSGKPQSRAPLNRPADSLYCKSETIGDDLEIDVGLFTSHNGVVNEEPEGKLYKDKFNYASLDCAATIVKTNSEASGANAILHENKDKYLLTPCSAPTKFVVIELCQDILVEEVAMANYEFFSSTFQKLRFSVSDRFPPKNGWKTLGEFDATNTRNVQKFEISNPLIWARYLRVEVLSHFGHEFYCPISIIRVHGKTMMDDFKLDESNEMYLDEQESPLSPEEQSGEFAEGKVTAPSFNGKVLDKCQFPRFRSTDNISIFPALEQAGTQCPAVLPHLEFDQFLKNLNQSACEPSKFQPPLDVSSSIPSSSTEESIFKTIIKRLNLLETNSTLSLRYVEEQSKLLSKAFSNLERNQAKKFGTLVNALNQTIQSNLEEISIFTKQLRESSLEVLEDQKLLNDHFAAETFKRLESARKDALFQRRLSYTMLFAFATLLIYVLLTKEAYVDEKMEDDGWYSKSPPLKKAKDNFLRKTGMEGTARQPLVFEASNGGSENGYRSDVSASSSSVSLYDDFMVQ
ncbi:LANO_0G02080g1_1 [Lachancea nothofagi CBS 11611]|uniref:SUN-like protein 1 n=1 Tax=Lachancea nothofagi CBS 11611 TaxID=1266666 RepID=A0A1G4KF37_9SACH|nr:LANO_0G02080g1_1 [Lachancea nothofagi CBS 11611]